MHRTQTAAERLAEALFVSSVVVNVVIQDDAGLAKLTAALAELTQVHGEDLVHRAAELVESAYDRVCSEIFIEPARH